MIDSREKLKDYCLRQLGHPVIEVNIEETQMEDCLDNAFQMFREYHYDSIQRAYISRQITIDEVTVSNMVGTFTPNEWVRSSVTGSTFQVYDVHGNIVRSNKVANGNILTGEVLAGDLSGATAVVVSVVIGDMSNRYVTVPDYVHSITKLVNWSQVTNRISMFDLRYQWRLNDVFSLTDTSMVYYTQMQMHLSLLDETLIAKPSLRFNRHTNRCHLDADFSFLAPDDYIVLECYIVLDTDEFVKVYNDRILKKLCVAYFKRQWGVNMSKYDKITMPGGIVLRGVEIYREGLAEVQAAEEELRTSFEVPSIFITG